VTRSSDHQQNACSLRLASPVELRVRSVQTCNDVPLESQQTTQRARVCSDDDVSVCHWRT